MGEKIGLRGDRITHLREKLNMTQMAAAYACNMNQGNLSMIERGRRNNITLETLDNLATGLKTSVEYLINRSNDPAPRRESVLDRLTDDEARMLLTYQELLPPAREAVLSLAQRISDIQRTLSDGLPGVPLPARRPK